jgi:formate hydrogenlyase subunit 3/multisubunit Na+/H+ antiporter MnhD subunit
MEFITIKEYFYKFHSRLMLILLLPILIFIILYLQHGPARSEAFQSEHLMTTVIATVVTILAIYLVLHIKRIKSARNGKGLRQKLEKYFRITIVRYFVIAVISLVFAAAFFFTRDDSYTYAFIINLLIGAVTWPRAKKVSSDLRLRGDERTMVYYKRDTL